MHADARHNVGGWELYDCVHVGNCLVVDWEAGNCALGDWGLSGGLGGWELCIGRLGTVHWEVGNCLVDWEAGDCALGAWEAGDSGCALEAWELGTA